MPDPFVSIPAGDVLLTRARIPCDDGLVETDIRIAGGEIVAVGRNLATKAEPQADLSGSIVFPAFVDLHTHIDKGHIWPRAHNPDGTHSAAVQAVMADRAANWTAEDVAARAGFRAPLRLRPRHHGTPHPPRQPRPAARHLLAGVPENSATNGPAALRCKPSHSCSSTPTRPPSSSAWPTGSPRPAACSAVSGALQPDAEALIARLFDLAVDRNLDIDLHVE